MGMYYTLILFKGMDETSFRKCLETAAKQLRGRITWGTPGDGKEDFRLVSQGETHTFYLPNQKNHHAYCLEVAKLCGLPWMELRIQESSIWDYSLFHGTNSVDDFSVCPQYWEGGELDEKEMSTHKGKPDVLAKLWNIPVERIERYLVNWGYKDDESDSTCFERHGKAYLSDKFDYGNYEQFFDFLAALGGKEPTAGHSIHLPL